MISWLSSSDHFTEKYCKVKRKSRFRVENGNGYIFGERYTIPEKVLPVILCYVNPEDLVFNCRLVCKAWCNAIDVDVWKLKFERYNYAVDESEKLPWFTCYWVFSKKQKFWNRNLVKNGCGQDQLEHWGLPTKGTCRPNLNDQWKVQKLKSEAENFPLEMNDEIKKHNVCFVPLTNFSGKEQIIDLAAEGITPELMDIVQPDIIISEWFKGRFDQASTYALDVELESEKKNILGFEKITSKKMSKLLNLEDCSRWNKIGYTLKNYGPGVRHILFRHFAGDMTFREGECGSKLTGSSVILRIPVRDKKLRNELFDVTSNYGYTFNKNHSIPEELLSTILSYVEPHDLVFNCRRVCKAWCNVVDEQVWKIKFKYNDRKMQKFSWVDWYWFVLNKKLWNRNLVKNGCGQDGLNYWKSSRNLENDWRVEKPPVGAKNFPSEMDDEIKRHNSCFVALNGSCSKEQFIDFAAEGVTPVFMDKVQPKIVITEWYSGRNDCPGHFTLQMALCDEKKNDLDPINLYRLITHQVTTEDEGEWHKVTHVFENYGPGVRYVLLQHHVANLGPWHGNFGIKITGISVILQIPDNSLCQMKQ